MGCILCVHCQCAKYSNFEFGREDCIASIRVLMLQHGYVNLPLLKAYIIVKTGSSQQLGLLQLLSGGKKGENELLNIQLCSYSPPHPTKTEKTDLISWARLPAGDLDWTSSVSGCPKSENEKGAGGVYLVCIVTVSGDCCMLAITHNWGLVMDCTLSGRC